MMRLNLKFPDSDGNHSFTEGANNCTAIYPFEGGWFVETGHGAIRQWFPAWKIEQTYETRDTSAKPENGVPAYAEALEGGHFKCKECDRVFAKLQSIKTHHGMTHAPGAS